MTLLAADAFLYQGMPRWSFGMDNPNKAATVLAFILILLLGALLRDPRGRVALLRDRIGKGALVAAAAAIGYCLVHTFSRGGLVAFLLGVSILFIGSWKGPRKFRRWWPILFVSLLMAGTAAWTGFAGRVARSLPADDASVGNRLAIWRNVPSMMVDAPGGWGRGASGDAFMGWYQPLERHERYRTLVNSHFTGLVEFGWVGRFALVWAWMFAFGMGIVRWKTRGDPLPLAVWVGFATAAFFSSVAEAWLVCAIPVAMLVPAVRAFCAAPVAARRLAVVATLLASGLLLSAVVVLGAVCRPSDVLPVHRSVDGARMTVGEGPLAGWIVCDEAAMGGAAYGRILRAYARTAEGNARTYCIARDLAAVPADARRIALCGRSADEGPGALARFTALADVRVLSPSRPADWLAERREKPFVRVFCGEFAPSCPAEDAEGLTVVSGAADYLPNWPNLAFGR